MQGDSCENSLIKKIIFYEGYYRHVALIFNFQKKVKKSYFMRMRIFFFFFSWSEENIFSKSQFQPILVRGLSVYEIFLTVSIYIGWLALYGKSSFHIFSDLLIQERFSSGLRNLTWWHRIQFKGKLFWGFILMITCIPVRIFQCDNTISWGRCGKLRQTLLHMVNQTFKVAFL